MGDGTGELCKFWNRRRQITQEKLERRFTDAQAVRRGLTENRFEVAGTVKRNNGRDVGRRIGIAGRKVLERFDAGTDADQGRQMTAGGGASD